MSRVVQAADKLQSMLSPEMVLTCLVLMLPVIIYRAYEWYIVSRVPLVSKSGSRAKTTYMIDSKSLLTQGYNQVRLPLQKSADLGRLIRDLSSRRESSGCGLRMAMFS